MEQKPTYSGYMDTPSPAEAAALPIYTKYGEAAVAGFQAVPDLLLKNQSKLELSATDLVVLLNILMHWWYPDQKPFPRSTTIAQRIGLTPRTVQRSMQHLEKVGLLKKETDDSGRVIFDPEPLVHRLEEIAPSDPDYLVRKARRNTT
ncbi:helix-turn-helix domain-containing protein [Shimia sp. R11_0]|uniref:helix-turn-helix domain-containing protein n=1 Tax=Shimia sp. R11_0 TaxID=2821096 RepID=UPI001ADC9C59|nr:helix-turn-helix domain-containing protein [Shimia sp. R11_0]MBO9479750.1 helix-turn-helix domain-containing protein [Shimia sp. R11_0]